MGLETKSEFIEDLNQAWPIGTVDFIDEADDHMRNIKEAVQGSFPNLGQASVNLTAAEINDIPNRLDASGVPIGGIIMYSGSFSAIPASYSVCDGSNGTPDLVGRFITGVAAEGSVGNIGGSADASLPSHNHTANHDHPNVTTSGGGAHSHDIPKSDSDYGGNVGFRDYDTVDGSVPTSSVGDHTHTLNVPNMNVTTSNTGVTPTDANLPPYYTLAYIQRKS